jgi:hypothetical protein
MNEDQKGRIWFFNYNSSVNFLKNDTIFNSKNASFLDGFLGNGFILNCFLGPDKRMHFYNWRREVFSLDIHNTIRKVTLFNAIHTVKPNLGMDINQIRVYKLEKSVDNNWKIWSSIGIFNQNDITGKITIIDSSLHCNGVYTGNNNYNYILTNDKIVKVDDDFRNKTIVPFAGNPANIKTILEDHDGDIWIAAFDEGVYCIYKNRLIRHFKIKEAQGLFEDHENNIWISTRSDGLYAINHDLLKQTHIGSEEFDGLGLIRLFYFPETGLWVINNKCAMLLKNNTIYKMYFPSYLQPIDQLLFLKDNSMVVGSLSSMICSFKGIRIDKQSKQIIFSDSTIVQRPLKRFITNNSGDQIAYYQQEFLVVAPSATSSLKSKMLNIHERVNNLFFNNDNELVINSKKNYLLKNSKLVPYPMLSYFNGNVITDHLSLDDSTELFNIDGDSLYVLCKGNFYNLTAAFNIPVTLPIKNITYDYPTLYLATFRDIFVCNHPLKVIHNGNLLIYPLNISFNNINDILVNNDSLYIASDDGLTVIPEASIAKSASNPPIPYLKSIQVNDIKLANNEGVTLTGKNKILLSFGCISYFTNSIIYSYMLEGSEITWTTGTGNDINIVYQSLPKGKYTFKLRVRKSNSDWSKPLELPITIRPTLIEYPAFWAISALLASGIVFLIIYRLRLQKMKKVEVDHQLVVMEQKALQSMMNPHFIFNSLSSIQNYLLKNKGEEAVIYLSNFSRLIRQNLNAINNPMIELSEEINRLKTYMELEKKRLDYKFDYSIKIGSGLENEKIFIPSMIVQPFAENSIWHGLSTLESNGVIFIGFYANDSKSLRIVIEDNGIGIKKSSEYYSESSHKKHLGMQIIRKRLDLLSKKYHTQTGVFVSECFPGQATPGTKVEIIVPFLYGMDENDTNSIRKME